MKKVIAFSLWGNDYRYLGGALQNVELAKYFYPEWVCRFYIGASTNKEFTNKLRKNINVEIINMSEMGDYTGMCWRFLSVSDPDVDVAIVRDADSRLHKRELVLVNEWVNSDKHFHIIRDHKFHTAKIMGGMWGSKKGLITNMGELVENYKLGDYWQTDQNFLRDIVYPKVKNVSLIHDYFSVLDNSPFPKELKNRDDNHFIGQAYDGDGKVLDKNIQFDDYIGGNIKLEKNGEFKR